MMSINLTHNSLTELNDGALFQQSLNLEEIDIDHNGLAVLSENLFRNLSKLRHLRLNNNELKFIHR